MSYNTYNTIILKKYPQTTSQAPRTAYFNAYFDNFLMLCCSDFQPAKKIMYICSSHLRIPACAMGKLC